MLGIGKWECVADTMFYKGKINIEITDNNGEYGFTFAAEGAPAIDFEIVEMHEENGDTLIGTIHTSMMPGKDIIATMKFTDDEHFDGSMKIPFMGKIKVKNGYKVG